MEKLPFLFLQLTAFFLVEAQNTQLVSLGGTCSSSVQCTGVGVCKNQVCICPVSYIPVEATCVYQPGPLLNSPPAPAPPPVYSYPSNVPPPPPGPSYVQYALPPRPPLIATPPSGPISVYPGASCVVPGAQCVGGSYCAAGHCACAPGYMAKHSTCIVAPPPYAPLRPQLPPPPSQPQPYPRPYPPHLPQPYPGSMNGPYPAIPVPPPAVSPNYPPSLPPPPPPPPGQPPQPQPPFPPPSYPYAPLEETVAVYPGASCGQRGALCIGGSSCDRGVCNCPGGYSLDDYTCVLRGGVGAEVILPAPERPLHYCPEGQAMIASSCIEHSVIKKFPGGTFCGDFYMPCPHGIQCINGLCANHNAPSQAQYPPPPPPTQYGLPGPTYRVLPPAPAPPPHLSMYSVEPNNGYQSSGGRYQGLPIYEESSAPVYTGVPGPSYSQYPSPPPSPVPASQYPLYPSAGKYYPAARSQKDYPYPPTAAGPEFAVAPGGRCVKDRECVAGALCAQNQCLCSSGFDQYGSICIQKKRLKETASAWNDSLEYYVEDSSGNGDE